MLSRVDGENVAERDLSDPGPWLAPGFGGRRYGLLRRRNAIYREFVALGKNATQKRILEFANRWGSIGVDERGLVTDGEIVEARVVSFRTWRKKAVRVAMLSGLWNLVRSNEVEMLADYVLWTDDAVVVRLPHVSGRLRPDLLTLYETDQSRLKRELSGPGDDFEETVLAERRRDSDLLRAWKPGDPIEPVRYFVSREVNRTLEGHVNRVVLYPDGGVHYVPDSLLTVVYIAFQDLIAGAVKADRECARCGALFTVTRKDKIYCGGNCAKRASDAKRRLTKSQENG
ncbi:MAG TPA: hypothetical protein VMR52_05965 [Dehalococcoidia bacterium]|nr:hypothetical protein [Dehalococcoidia bacterium]